MLLFSGMLRGWRSWQQESPEAEQREIPPALGKEETPGTHLYGLGDGWLKSSFAGKALGILVDTKWNVASITWLALGSHYYLEDSGG